MRYPAPLAEVTGFTVALDHADSLLRGITGPVGSAWLLGMNRNLSVTSTWLDRNESACARKVLTPLLSAAERLP